MSKKKSKKIKKIKKTKQVSDIPKEISGIGNLLSRSWFPYALFGLLSILYFIRIFINNEVFLSAEGGNYTDGSRQSFDFLINLFRESTLWTHSYGGYPVSASLVERFHWVFIGLFWTFMSSFRAVTLYLMLITFGSGCFMYLFLRSISINRLPAVIMGIVYMFSPLYLSLTYAFHITKMSVIALLPMLIYFVEKVTSSGKWIFSLLLAFGIGCVIYTAHLQMAYFALWGVAYYVLFKIIIMLKEKINLRILLYRCTLIIIATVLGLGMGFRGAYPPYKHNKTVSKRAYVNEQEQKKFAASWGFHSEEVASLVVPEFGGYNDTYWGKNGFKINVEYFGFLPIFFLFLSFGMLRRNPYVLFSFIAFVFCILFALGSHTPVHSFCYHLIPGVKNLRGPSMISFLFVFAAVVMASAVLDRLFFMTDKNQKVEESFQRKCFYFAIGAAIFSVIVGTMPKILLVPWKTIFYSDISPQREQLFEANLQYFSRGFLFFALYSGIIAVLLYFRRRKRITVCVIFFILVVIGVFDEWRVGRKFLNTVSVPGGIIEKPKAAAYEWIKEKDKSLFRVFPYHLGTNYSHFLYEGITMITNFHDFTIKRYDNLMGLFYSVFYNILRGQFTQNEDFFCKILNLTNTKYLVSQSEIPIQTFEKKFQGDGLFVIENTAALPWYYIVKQVKVVQNEEQILMDILSGTTDLKSTAIIEENPPSEFTMTAPVDSAAAESITLLSDNIDRGEISFEIQTNFPSFFVLSENYHPDWYAYVDGNEQDIYRTQYVWKGVFIPEGSHTLEFRFLPDAVVFSSMITKTSLIIIFAGFVISLFWNRVVRKRQSVGTV